MSTVSVGRAPAGQYRDAGQVRERRTTAALVHSTGASGMNCTACQDSLAPADALYGDAGVLCPVCFHEADTALTVDHERVARHGRVLGWGLQALWLWWVTGSLWVEALPWLLGRSWRAPIQELWVYDTGGSIVVLLLMFGIGLASMGTAGWEWVKAVRDPFSSRSRLAVGVEHSVYLLLLGLPTASLLVQAALLALAPR